MRSVCRVPRHLSQLFDSIMADGRIIPTDCVDFTRVGMATRTSDLPWTHFTVATIFRLLAATALSAANRAEVLNMAFLAKNLPEPGARDLVALKALLAANADRSLTSLVAISAKRPYEDAGDPPYTAVHMLFSQQTNCTGRPLKLARRDVEVHRDTMDIIARLNIPVATATDAALMIPVATVDDDNEQLVFGRTGVPVCSRREDCIAHLIDGPPSAPLDAYRGVGHDPSCNECLLCIRHHLGMIVQMHRTHGSRPPVGLLPPFANIVDAPGGYRSAFCGVTPNDIELVSGAVHIMGSPVSFKKSYNPYTRMWYVDQSAAVYGSTGFFF